MTPLDRAIEQAIRESDQSLFGTSDFTRLREKWSDAARAASLAARRARKYTMRDSSRRDTEGIGKFARGAYEKDPRLQTPWRAAGRKAALLALSPAERARAQRGAPVGAYRKGLSVGVGSAARRASRLTGEPRGSQWRAPGSKYTGVYTATRNAQYRRRASRFKGL